MTLAMAFIEDDAVWVRMQKAWWLAQEDVAIHKFSSLIQSTLATKGYIPTHYIDDKTAWEMVGIQGKYFRQLLKARVQKSPFYGIMIDETMDQSTTSQLIIYIKFLERDAKTGVMEIKVEYLDLLTPTAGTAHEIMVFLDVNSV